MTLKQDKYYYAVAIGKIPGVYFAKSIREYNERVRDMTNGFSGNRHKKFDTLDDALNFMNQYAERKDVVYLYDREYHPLQKFILVGDAYEVDETSVPGIPANDAIEDGHNTETATLQEVNSEVEIQQISEDNQASDRNDDNTTMAQDETGKSKKEEDIGEDVLITKVKTPKSRKKPPQKTNPKKNSQTKCTKKAVLRRSNPNRKSLTCEATSKEEKWKWIRCGKCTYWYETSCVNVILPEDPEEINKMKYTCRMCHIENRLQLEEKKNADLQHKLDYITERLLILEKEKPHEVNANDQTEDVSLSTTEKLTSEAQSDTQVEEQPNETDEMINEQFFVYNDTQYIVLSEVGAENIETICQDMSLGHAYIDVELVNSSYKKHDGIEMRNMDDSIENQQRVEHLGRNRPRHFGQQEGNYTNADNDGEKVTQKGLTFLIGSSRIGNIIRSMRTNNLRRKCIAKFKGGSNIEWAKQTAADLQPDVTTVFQTGINNILNTSQSTKNIVHQFRMLTKEGINRGHKVIITSILPTNIGGYAVAKKIEDVNTALKNVVEEEGGIFADATHYFLKNGKIVEDLYHRDKWGLLHLNAQGGMVMTHLINEAVIESGGNHIVENFRTPSLNQRK